MTAVKKSENHGESLPVHVAIIMDGNGRWAQLRGKGRSAGHRAGGKTVRLIIEAAYRQNIAHLTLFAFSSENWQRPQNEVDLLMELFMRSLRKEINELHDNDVKVNFIGERSDFAPALQKAMQDAEQLTQGNHKLTVNIAVGYGGRWDITQACRRLAEDVRSGKLEPCNINEQEITNRLSLFDKVSGENSPDPDLLIRTGGEQRISNFLLWQMAYTELYFCDTLWPDFNENGFKAALQWFAKRQRRFGSVPEQIKENS